MKFIVTMLILAISLLLVNVVSGLTKERTAAIMCPVDGVKTTTVYEGVVFTTATISCRYKI